jgi:hypothetical protein
VNVDLDTDIDRLYAASRDAFVAERGALVKKLRASGEREEAAEVATLRKPTLVAWTVNQLAHTRRRDVDLLLDAGKRIIDAQQTSISEGGRKELDAAQTSLRTAVNGLAASAGELLGPDASTNTLTRVAETLRTAATSPTGRELLARGRLTEELSETGWEIVAGFTPPPKTDRPKPEKKAPSRAAEKRALEKRLRELEKSRSAARKRQRDAQGREAAAAARLEELRAARAEVDEELDALADEIETVEKGLRELDA